MATVDMHSAVQLASTGIITVLDAQLPTELAAVKLATYNAALPLDAPSKYFEVFTEAHVDTDVRNAGRVACFVYQSSDFESETQLTGAVTERTAVGITEFSVVVAFHMSPYEPWVKPWDVTENISTEEVMTQRARAYAGGIINTVLKYGCSQTGVNGIELLSNEPGQVEFNEEGKPIMGYSHTTFAVLQHVTWPAPAALP